MTVTEKPTLRFSLKIFPWLVMLAAVAVYLTTANRWVTLNSLPVVGKLLGWDWWSNQTTPPLLYLITLPLTFLPASSVPAIMNALSAVLAALTLGTLARSVALLPQDRTREQRQKEHTPGGLLSLPTNWIPPLFAILALGFQMTFWEHATAATGEMLNLLLFAHLVRCLLEYRQGLKESWLFQFALVYGLATTNNWGMIGFAPIFLLVLVWLKGKSFFKPKFLGKLALYGLIGLLLYLLMPMVESSHGNGPFFTLLREQLGQQKLLLKSIPLWLPLILSFVVFLPLLSMGIRWPSNMGEANPIAAFLTGIMFHLVHALFLGFSIWVMFDPRYSPRAMAGELTFLTFYYLIAISIGYYTGYFLLLFRESEQRGWKRVSAWQRGLNWIITIAVWVGPIATAGFLIYRNLPAIQGNNGNALKEYTERMASSLPASGAVLLSEEPHLLLLLEAYYSAGNKSSNLLLDTRSLPYARYHSILAKHYPGRWIDQVNGRSLPDPLPGQAVAELISLQSRSNKVFYLHPAIGPHVLEFFHLVQHGLVYELSAFKPSEVTPPVASGELLEQNGKFWQGQREFLNTIMPAAKQPGCDAAVVGRYLSRALNWWGVELAQAGKVEDARKFYEEALRLSPLNVAAKINLDGKVENENWAKGMTWSALLRKNGPFAIPQLEFELGHTMKSFGLLRQAVENLYYACEGKTPKLEYVLELAEVYLRGQSVQLALQTIDSAHRSPDYTNLNVLTRIEFARLEAKAYTAQTNLTKAEHVLLPLITEAPTQDTPLATLISVYLAGKKYSNALVVADKQLTINSNNATAWMNKGAIYLELNDYPRSAAALEQSLKLSPTNVPGLLNYGLVKTRMEDFVSAEKTYLKLSETQPDMPAPYFYLGEIAYRQKKKAEAIRYYEIFLKKIAPNAPEVAQAQSRLRELKGN